MSTRLATGGRLLNKARAVTFNFNKTDMRGFEGDTLASALLANDQMLIGRSFKYHRPRGLVASGAEEPNGLVNMGAGGKFEPNQRVTTTELFEGLSAESQNHWPSLEFDVGAMNKAVALYAGGFYYKMFIHPRPLWKHVYEPIIRAFGRPWQSAKRPRCDTYEHFYAFCDVLIVGGGVAGLASGQAAGASGAKVLLVEQTAHWGGRAPVDGGQVDGDTSEDWVTKITAELNAMDNVTIRTRTMGAGVYDHGYVLGYERLTDHTP